MNTEQFIRESAARGLSRRATRLALDQARKARKDKHTHTVRGRTGTIEELVETLPSPVSASTVRRRLAAGMSLEDALLTPHLPPKPGHRHPQIRPTCDFAQVAVSQQVQP
ncbi:hypothetical protein SOJ48_29610 [Pseudomonas aeruginosa]|uniref:hypothetical protein n=1 Tax=Pseudomonas aeruginosa TaxID=287 RepID=UPI002A6B417C|nr:hypothetical protein [Pseudomonas aeruginosa]MDY1341083.1 hypothetical protein [Pseudomonas aeruginosa]